MDETIKELTLLLIYLTSWQEDVGLTKVQRSWKGYPFDALDELNEEEQQQGQTPKTENYFLKKAGFPNTNVVLLLLLLIKVHVFRKGE